MDITTSPNRPEASSSFRFQDNTEEILIDLEIDQEAFILAQERITDLLPGIVEWELERTPDCSGP